MCKNCNPSMTISFSRFPKNQTPCGICHSRSHRGMLNARSMKEHDCLAKQCSKLEPVYEHSFWEAKWKKEMRRAAFKVLSDRYPRISGYTLRKQVGKMNFEELKEISGMTPPEKLAQAIDTRKGK